MLFRAPHQHHLLGDRRQAEVDARLRRVDNLNTNPSFSLMVDHYEEDWTKLWWVRVDGSGGEVEDGAERERALDLLAVKYPQYRETPPPGPVLALDIENWRTWP